jgi:hypothetical protein
MGRVLRDPRHRSAGAYAGDRAESTAGRPRDRRAARALRARGYDLVVLEISPVEDAPRNDLPLRLWRLQRETLRSRFETLGTPVAHWEPSRAGVELTIEEVITLRRHARPVARV